MFTVYLTFYLGNRLPPFYIGSAPIARLSKGYRGSASSAQYSAIWKEELKTHPELFVTFAIPGQTAQTATEILDLELAWQQQFDVVNNPLFVNQSFAKAGFCSTAATAKKAAATRKKNGKNWCSEETKAKISKANGGKPATPRGDDFKETMRRAMTGRTLTKEWRAKISAANTGKKHREETIQRLKESHLGIKTSVESVAKRLDTIAQNGGYAHSEETKAKISAANRGKKLSPQSAEAKAKRSAALTGRTRSPEATEKMKATMERKRLEKQKLAVARQL